MNVVLSPMQRDQ